ncbi:hypothetical protein OnM2_052050, partial [Erysiphe neolycopersici]
MTTPNFQNVAVCPHRAQLARDLSTVNIAKFEMPNVTKFEVKYANYHDDDTNQSSSNHKDHLNSHLNGVEDAYKHETSTPALSAKSLDDKTKSDVDHNEDETNGVNKPIPTGRPDTVDSKDHQKKNTPNYESDKETSVKGKENESIQKTNTEKQQTVASPTVNSTELSTPKDNPLNQCDLQNSAKSKKEKLNVETTSITADDRKLPVKLESFTEKKSIIQGSEEIPPAKKDSATEKPLEGSKNQNSTVGSTTKRDLPADLVSCDQEMVSEVNAKVQTNLTRKEDLILKHVEQREELSSSKYLSNFKEKFNEPDNIQAAQELQIIEDVINENRSNTNKLTKKPPDVIPCTDDFIIESEDVQIIKANTKKSVISEITEKVGESSKTATDKLKIIENSLEAKAMMEEASMEKISFEEDAILEPAVRVVPGDQKAVVEEAKIEKPVLEEPMLEEVALGEKVAKDEIAVAEPVVEDSAAEEHVVEDSVLEKIEEKEAAEEESAVEHSTTEENIKEETKMEEIAVVEKVAVGDPIVEKTAVEEDAVTEDVAVKEAFTSDLIDEELAVKGVAVSEVGTKEEIFVEEQGVEETAAKEIAEIDPMLKNHVVEESAVEDSTVEESAMEDSAVEDVAKEELAVGEPIVEKLAMEELAIEEPAVEKPAVEESAVEESAEEMAVVEPVVEESAKEEPTVKKTAVEESAVLEPVAEEPALVEPAVEEPDVKEPTRADPVVDEPDVEKPAGEEVEKEQIEKKELTVEDSTVKESTVEDPVVEEPAVEDVAKEELAVEE